MNRDFRFRGWDKRMKCLFNVKYLNYDKGLKVGFRPYAMDPPVFLSVPDEAELLQMTGIKDRHDIDIYEGDIVVAEDGYIGVSNWQVIWRDDRWHLDNGEGGSYDNGDYYHGDQIDWEKCLIIGNVFENPNLLNQSEKP